MKHTNNGLSAQKKLRWLWQVEDYNIGKVMTFVFDGRTHRTIQRLRGLFKGHQIRAQNWFTDDWWAYLDLLKPKNIKPAKETLKNSNDNTLN